MPTVALGGAAHVLDNNIDKYTPTRNFGAKTSLQVGYQKRVLVKLQSASIPSGTITGFRFCYYRFATAASSYTSALLINRLIVDWVCGTSNNVDEAGASCWDNRTSSAWNAGGASGENSDYDASDTVSFAFEPYTSGPNLLTSVDLPTAWAKGWRDGTLENYGFRIRTQDEPPSAVNMVIMMATDNSSDKPYFEIDYVVGGPPSQSIHDANASHQSAHYDTGGKRRV